MTRRPAPARLPLHAYEPDLVGTCARDGCGLPPDHHSHALPPAATMNATGSPTGRVTRDAPDTSRRAAQAVRAPGHRQIIAQALLTAGTAGLTSIEAAAALPYTRHGGPQVSNRSASRLGELWEAGQATIRRQWGVCVLGVCHPYNKPAVVHRPSASCPVHGPAVTRDGAAVWVAVAHTPGHR